MIYQATGFDQFERLDWYSIQPFQKKLWSLAFLERLGFPIAHVLSVSPPGIQSLRSIEHFMRKLKFDRVTVRKESVAGESWRGGMTQKLEQISALLKNHPTSHFLLLEPLDATLNGYNLVLGRTSQDRCILEVVGPGFDVSDLQRGNVSPHEIFEFDVNSKRASFRRVRLVEQSEYEMTVQIRRNKIKEKYASGTHARPSIPEEYTPISYKTIHQFLRPYLVAADDVEAFFGNEFTISGSFCRSTKLEELKLIYWDVFKAT